MAETQVLFLQKSTGMDVLHQNYQYVTLPHPRSGPSVFLVEDGNIFELQKVTPRQLGCMFTAQKISSDNSVYVATLVDPRFLILPYLTTGGGKFSPLNQMLPFVEGCAQIPLQNIDKWKMEEMCDVNDKLGPDMILYKYNESKVMEWLQGKVQGIALVVAKKRKEKLIAQKNNCVETFRAGSQSEKASSSSVSAQASGGSSDTAALEPEKCDTLEAIDLLGDYISDDVSNRLLEMMRVDPNELSNLRAPKTATKRKADWEAALEIESETLQYQGNVGTVAIPKKPTAVASSAPTSSGFKAKIQKTADKSKPPAGTKSISSFFAKK